MHSRGKISVLQLILLSITTIGFQIHVLILDPMLNIAGKDAWITHILNLFPSVLWALIVFYIIKNLNQIPLDIWIQEKLGKKARIIFGSILYVALLLLATNTLKLTIGWAKISFLDLTPSYILYIIFIAICFFAAYYGLQALAIANVFFLSIVLSLGVFIGLVNIPRKDYSYLTPLFENGLSDAFSALFLPFACITEIFLFIALSHKTMKPIKIYHMIGITILLCLLGIGPTIGAISEFGLIEAQNQAFSAYEQWGIGELGKYIAHLDFGSIFQWLSGVYIRISLVFIVAQEYFRPKKRINKVILLGVTSCLMLLLCSIPISNITYQLLYQKILIPFSGTLFVTSTLFIAILMFITKRKERKQHEINTES